MRVFCFTPGDYQVEWARSLKADSLLQQVVATGIFIHYKRRADEKYLPEAQVFPDGLPQKSGNIFLIRPGVAASLFCPCFPLPACLSVCYAFPRVLLESRFSSWNYLLLE